MSYTKQDWNKFVWKEGQANFQDMLNHMEDGIANAGGGSGAEYTAGHGIKIENNEISTDVDVVADVDYVDGNITDTMLYIDQQDRSEHAGRVAGDELLQAAIDKKQDKLAAGENVSINEENVISAEVGSDDLIWESGSGEKSVQTKGTGCDARGAYSVAEGNGTLAESDLSHAEGWVTRTIIDDTDTDTHGHASHAEGSHTIAKGACSHAEGNTTESMGMYSHAEGSGTISGGRSSHAEGDGTVTENVAEHAEGSYNKSHTTKYGDAGNTIHSIGIGTSMSNRKNAVEVLQSGDVFINGVGEFDGANIADAKTVQDVLSDIAILVGEKADKLEVLPVSAYGFDTNLAMKQLVDGSALVDRVLDSINEDKKQVIIKAGDYKFQVIGTLQPDTSTGYKGFAIETLLLDPTALETTTPKLQKCVFLYVEALNKTINFYDQDFTRAEIEGVVGQIQTAIAGLQPKLTAGENITIENNVISSTGSSSGIIAVARDIVLVPDIEDDKILHFTATVLNDKFPKDFSTEPERYNLIVRISGEDGSSVADTSIGYTANHFCYVTTRSDSGELEMMEYRCQDTLDIGPAIYHYTTMTVGMGDTYVLQYEGKVNGETVLGPDNAKVSVFLQKLY